MPLLTNCLINTSRSIFNVTTGSSSTPQPYLNGILGHIMPHRTFFNPKEMFPMPMGGGLETEYAIKVDKDKDIRTGDIVSAIFRTDGVTPWPGFDANETWRVSYAYPTDPLFLEERVCIVTRITGGGPVY